MLVTTDSASATLERDAHRPPSALRGALDAFVADLDRALANAHEHSLELLYREFEADAPDEARSVRFSIYRCVRDLKLREPRLRGGVIASVRSQLDRFEVGTLPIVKPRLALMEDKDLESAIATAAVTAAAEAHLADVLAAIASARVPHDPAGAAALVQSSLAPRALFAAYDDALAELDVEPEVRTALLRALESNVFRTLAPAYDRIAQALGAKLLARNPPVGAAESRASALPTDTEGVVRSVLNLLAQRHRSAGDAATAARRDVIDALDRLQATGAPGPLARLGELTLFELLAHSLGDDGDAREIAPAERVVVDLVELVFEFVVDRAQLLPCFRSALRPLRVPYAKVALLDPALFVRSEHPARRLLDELARVAAGYDTESAALERSLGHVRRIVGAVLESNARSIDAFDDLLHEFRRSMRLVEDRTERVESRAVRAARTRESLAEAWIRTARALRAMLASREVPSLIEAVLLRPWAQYLVLIELSERAEDTRAAALDVARTLVELTDRSSPFRDSARAAKRLAEHAAELHRGLLKVGYDPGAIQRLWRAVAPIALGRDPGPVCIGDLVPPAGYSVEQALTRFASHAEEANDAAPPTTGRIGTWYETASDDGTWRRVKLSWIGRRNTSFLFVWPTGLLAFQVDATELEARLRSGVLRLAGAASPVDHALRHVLHHLDPANATAA